MVIVTLRQATSYLLKMVDAKTRIIPAIGPVQTKQDLQTQHDMVSTVGNTILTMIQQGKGYSEIVAAAPTKEFDAKWGSPDRFVTSAYKGIMRNLQDVNAIKL